MENHTKRIRKARRQGLADNGKALARSPRVRFSSRLTAAEIPAEPRAARRRELITGRKAKRQQPRSLRRGAAQARARR